MERLPAKPAVLRRHTYGITQRLQRNFVRDERDPWGKLLLFWCLNYLKDLRDKNKGRNYNIEQLLKVYTFLYSWQKKIYVILIHQIELRFYGCSFVAKLSWKKNYFFLKKYIFLQKIHYLQKKWFYMEKKSFILKIFFTEKNFFYREKYKWKCKKYISHFKNIFLHRKCLCYK